MTSIKDFNKNAIPNKWKPLALIFTVLAIGSTAETSRIITSAAPDIAKSRAELSLMAIIITALFVFLAIRFWRKSAATRNS